VVLLISDQAYVGQEMGHVIHPPMKVTTKGSINGYKSCFRALQQRILCNYRAKTELMTIGCTTRGKCRDK
jgi:hypothetical protein